MPSPLQIKPFEVSDAGHRLTAEFILDGKIRQVYFASSDLPLHPSSEALLTLAILPAMLRNVVISAPDLQVSALFLASIAEVQAFFHNWRPELSQVEIQGPNPIALKFPTEFRQGLFFSGGVDSYYSLLTHQGEIKDLVVLHGYDISLHNLARRQLKSELVQRVGKHFGLRVIEIETDIFSWFSHNPSWHLAHGAALAAVGHLLVPYLSGLYMAASHAFLHEHANADKHHRGLYFKLDPLWSSEALQFASDGGGIKRVNKVVRVAQDNFALETLMVCNEDVEHGLNCCRCNKCLRTMVSLRILGVLDKCPTFPEPLDLALVAGSIPVEQTSWAYTNENLELLESSSRSDPELETALRQSLSNYPKGKLIRIWRRYKRRLSKLLALSL